MPSQNNAIDRLFAPLLQGSGDLGRYFRQRPIISTILIILSVLLVLAVAAGIVGQRVGEAQRARTASVDVVPKGAGPLLRPLSPEEFTLAPEAIRQLDADAARLFNEAIPFSQLPVQAAKPFIMTPTDIVQYSRALDCLSAAIF